MEGHLISCLAADNSQLYPLSLCPWWTHSAGDKQLVPCSCAEWMLFKARSGKQCSRLLLPGAERSAVMSRLFATFNDYGTCSGEMECTHRLLLAPVGGLDDCASPESPCSEQWDHPLSLGACERPSLWFSNFIFVSETIVSTNSYLKFYCIKNNLSGQSGAGFGCWL